MQSSMSLCLLLCITD